MSSCTRRTFCAASCAGLALAAACGDNGMPMGGDDLGGDSPDLAGTQASGNCGTGSVAAGAASAYSVGTAKHFSDRVNYDIFVVRDAGGLYALSASCPHAGCTVQHQASGGFYCPCHAATFDANGGSPTRPARSPLEHYALCLDGQGNITVDYNTVVPATTRS